ncbi:hypothetical protein ACIGFK_38235 [Streptomyces sp. NPDC085524]|uniref:hypothetical protein n=1 Tax=Streptomyces sp. NPDC085524 TaxID=3365728 RepID=UPI0037D8AEAF
MAPDLPHLFARLSELVHVAGYAPEDLVVMPRSEIDRRETAAFTAGWAEAMSEELPRIRREYERRVADAYAAGGGRGTDAAARRTPATGQGATVIRLPFATLLEPSPLVVETEERMRRAQEILDRGSAAVTEPVSEAGTEAEAPDQPAEPEGSEPLAQPAASRASADAREKRTLPASRKVVRRKGRPIVPPLNSVPVQPRMAAPPAEPPADGPGTAGEPERRSLAARARALATDLENRAGTGRPEVPENSR